MLGLGELDELEARGHSLLLLGTHAVELLPQNVLHIHFLQGDQLPLLGRPPQKLADQPQIHLPQLAGIEQVAGLDDETEERTQVKGEFAAERTVLGSEAEAHQLRQRLRVLLHF